MNVNAPNPNGTPPGGGGTGMFVNTSNKNGPSTSTSTSSPSSKNNGNGGIGISVGPSSQSSYYYTSSLDLTPSRQDGMSATEENRLRRLSCSFIGNMCSRLRFPIRTFSTACVLFHRYYSRHSLNDQRREHHEVAAGAVFLACKIEESPRKVGEVVEAMQYIIMPSEHHYHDVESPEVIRARDTLLACESSLLDSTDYSFSFIHPQQLCMVLIRRAFNYQSSSGSSKPSLSSSSSSSLSSPFSSSFNHQSALPPSSVNDERVTRLGRDAWLLCNESMKTPLCLQYRPQHLSIAILVLASHYNRMTIPTIRANLNTPSLSSSSILLNKQWWRYIAPQLDDSTVHRMCWILLENGAHDSVNYLHLGHEERLLSSLREDPIIKSWKSLSTSPSPATAQSKMVLPSSVDIGATALSLSYSSSPAVSFPPSSSLLPPPPYLAGISAHLPPPVVNVPPPPRPPSPPPLQSSPSLLLSSSSSSSTSTLDRPTLPISGSPTIDKSQSSQSTSSSSSSASNTHVRTTTLTITMTETTSGDPSRSTASSSSRGRDKSSSRRRNSRSGSRSRRRHSRSSSRQRHHRRSRSRSREHRERNNGSGSGSGRKGYSSSSQSSSTSSSAYHHHPSSSSSSSYRRRSRDRERDHRDRYSNSGSSSSSSTSSHSRRRSSRSSSRGQRDYRDNREIGRSRYPSRSSRSRSR